LFTHTIPNFPLSLRVVLKNLGEKSITDNMFQCIQPCAGTCADDQNDRAQDDQNDRAPVRGTDCNPIPGCFSCIPPAHEEGGYVRARTESEEAQYQLEQELQMQQQREAGVPLSRPMKMVLWVLGVKA